MNDGLGGSSPPQGQGSVAPPAPTLVSLNTSQGTTLGGTVIIATGTNLTGASAVSVGGNPATSVSALDATHVQFTTPAGSAGAASITVTTPGGTSSPLAGAFTYVVVVAPVLESISRDIGIAAGGTKQTLRGYGLTGTTGVTWGGASATSVVVVSDNVVTCVTPSGTASETAVDVVITNSAGSSTLSAAFEYLPTTTISYAIVTDANLIAGNYGGFGTTGSPSIVNIPATLGSATKAIKCETTSVLAAETDINLNVPNNAPLNQPAGMFWCAAVLIPSATVTLCMPGSGQIKTYIGRVGNSNPATTISAIGGGESTGGATQIKSVVDFGSVGYLGSCPGVNTGDGYWMEEVHQVTRASGVSGRDRRWVNGKKCASVTSANIGSDVTTDVTSPRIGNVFTQNTSVGTLDVYVASGAYVANGYSEPAYL